MADKRQSFKHINLLPQDEFDRSLIGKVFTWAITAGKTIVILTEFVVILAFMSRFKLDRDYNDENEKVIQKQKLVESLQPVETRMRAAQEKMDLVEEINTVSLATKTVVDQVVAATPFGITIDSLVIDRSSIRMEGIASTEQSLDTLIAKYKELEDYPMISLSNIEFSPRKGGVLFTLVAEAAKKEVAKK